MGRKRVFIGQAEFGIDDNEVETVVAQIKSAMESGAIAELSLRDGANRPVTVYLNPKLAPSVVVDLDLDPKPTEISGG